MCDVMLPKERTDGIDGIIRYRPAPTQSWRNTNKVEPDAAKDPMSQDTEDRYALQL